MWHNFGVYSPSCISESVDAATENQMISQSCINLHMQFAHFLTGLILFLQQYWLYPQRGSQVLRCLGSQLPGEERSACWSPGSFPRLLACLCVLKVEGRLPARRVRWRLSPGVPAKTDARRGVLVGRRFRSARTRLLRLGLRARGLACTRCSIFPRGSRLSAASVRGPSRPPGRRRTATCSF